VFEGRKRAVFDSARENGYLDPDEELEEMAFGQTMFSPFLYLLIIPFPLIFLARQQAFTLTNKNIRVFKQSMWSTKKVTEMLESQPRQTAQATATAFGLRVGAAPKGYAFLGQQGPMKTIAAAAGGGEAPPEPPQIPPAERPAA
jgi:hypothetical protein